MTSPEAHKQQSQTKTRAPTYSFQEYLEISTLPGCANSLNENPEHLCTGDSGGLTKGLIKSTVNKKQIVIVVFFEVQMFSYVHCPHALHEISVVVNLHFCGIAF